MKRRVVVEIKTLKDDKLCSRKCQGMFIGGYCLIFNGNGLKDTGLEYKRCPACLNAELKSEGKGE